MTIYVPGAGIEIPDGNYTVPPGPYEGVTLSVIPVGLLRFQDSAICHVSGSGGNPFGHSMFMIGPGIGYVHAVEPGVHPVRFLPHDEYATYMKVMGKVAWNMHPVDLPNPTGAANYITQALLVGYNWQPFHNCLEFCDEIVNAAGGNANLTSLVFPSTATKQPEAIKTPLHRHPWDAIGDDDL